jgi:hypothetical protein
VEFWQLGYSYLHREQTTLKTIHGYEMTLCKSLSEKIFMGRVKISDIVPPNEVEVALGFPGAWNGLHGLSVGNQHQLAEPQDPATDDSIAAGSFPDLSDVSPLSLIVAI